MLAMGYLILAVSLLGVLVYAQDNISPLKIPNIYVSNEMMMILQE
jgi:hypothetical protein